jgi:hypothetical protein
VVERSSLPHRAPPLTLRWRFERDRWVEACIATGMRERPPLSGIKYVAFADPSGGASDSFAMAIAHHDNGIGVLDLVHERRPPFSPEAVCTEFAHTLRAYRLSALQGDRYGGAWVSEAFRKLISAMNRPPRSRVIFIATCCRLSTAGASNCSICRG